MSWKQGKLSFYRSQFEREVTPPENIDDGGFIKEFPTAEESLAEFLHCGLFSDLKLSTEHLQELAFISNAFTEAMLTDLYERLDNLLHDSPDTLNQIKKYSNMMFFQGFVFALYLWKRGHLLP